MFQNWRSTTGTSKNSFFPVLIPSSLKLLRISIFLLLLSFFPLKYKCNLLEAYTIVLNVDFKQIVSIFSSTKAQKQHKWREISTRDLAVSKRTWVGNQYSSKKQPTDRICLAIQKELILAFEVYNHFQNSRTSQKILLHNTILHFKLLGWVLFPTVINYSYFSVSEENFFFQKNNSLQIWISNFFLASINNYALLHTISNHQTLKNKIPTASFFVRFCYFRKGSSWRIIFR